MSKILSISVAAYNMEKYIGRAIESLIDERIIDDLEIFVVDDGGADKTLEIAEQYAQRYSHSIFPVHKENGGYGSTVNYSISHATGKYFKLLDGDDWFDRDGLYQLVMTLKTIDVDVVITNHCEGVDAENLKWYKNFNGQQKKVFEIKDINIKGSFPNVQITYRLDLIKKSMLVMPEHIMYTDNLYVAIPYSYAETVYYIDCCVYCYWKGRDDQSINQKSIQKHIDEHDNVSRMISARYEKEKRSKSCKNISYIRFVAERTHVTTFKWYMTYMPLSKDTKKRFMINDKRMWEVSPEIYKGSCEIGKWGLLLRLIRASNYILYSPIKLLMQIILR